MMTTRTTAVGRLRLRHHRHHLIIFLFLFLAGFFLRELRFFRWLGGNQNFQSIVIGLQPGLHLFLQGAGQKSDILAERDDGPRNGQPIIARFLIGGLKKCASGGKQSFAGAGLPEACHQGNSFIHERIDEKLLFQIARADGDSARGFHEIRQVQAPH